MAGRHTRSKATAGSKAPPAAGSSLSDLPSECLDAIIELLPPNCIPLSLRRLSKEWRQRFLQHTTVTINEVSSYLPPWAVLAALPEVPCPKQQRQMLAVLARCGDLEGMQQLAQHELVRPLVCSDVILCAAAGSGRLDLVRWLVQEQGCNALAGNSEGTAHAAYGGHMHVLQFLRVHEFRWAHGTMAAAARRDHLTTLEWLHSNGCGSGGIRACLQAASSGRLEALQFLLSHGYAWDPALALHAACITGHLHIVRWIFHESGNQWGLWDSEALSRAATRGHVEVVEYMLQQGCPSDPDLTAVAAEAGQREVLLWLRQHGHAWTADTFASAAGRCDLQLLQWLRAQAPPCPWDSSAMVAVAQARAGNAKPCLEWLLSNGCPWDAAAFRAVLKCPELRGVQFPGVRRSKRRVQ